MPLARGDHVDVELVEALRVLTHRVGEAGTALDVHPRLLQDLAEGLVLLLAAQDLEALHERQARVDHHRELASEDREVLRGNPAAELGQHELAPLLLHGRDQDLVAPQDLHHGFFVVGDPLAGNHLAVAGLALPDVSRHFLSSRASGPPAALAHGRPVE
jgi:hypothetical protein